jgi:hypothetical protein
MVMFTSSPTTTPYCPWWRSFHAEVLTVDLVAAFAAAR